MGWRARRRSRMRGEVGRVEGRRREALGGAGDAGGGGGEGQGEMVVNSAMGSGRWVSVKVTRPEESRWWVYVIFFEAGGWEDAVVN